MLDIILEKHVLYVLMGIFTVVGLVSKIIASTTLKKLVQAAGNMSKSSHPLMRLVRAKFEHACMVSDKVENVGAFVDKYLYEYRVCGMRIHSLQRVERVSIILCLLSGATGAFAEYSLYGMSEAVLRLGSCGAVLAIVIFLIQLSTDEKYRLEAARNYMVDYLENVCLHRYEKANQKEQQRKAENKAPVEQLEIKQVIDEAKAVQEEIKPEILEIEAMEPGTETETIQTRNKRQSRKLKKASQTLAAASERVESDVKMAAEQLEQSDGLRNGQEKDLGKESWKEQEKESDKMPAKDVLIRQILEEYMA